MVYIQSVCAVGNYGIFAMITANSTETKAAKESRIITTRLRIPINDINELHKAFHEMQIYCTFALIFKAAGVS